MGGDIDVVTTEKGEPAIRLQDLIYQMFEHWRYQDSEAQSRLISRIFETDKFNELLVEYLRYGDPDGNQSDYVHQDFKIEFADKTRRAVLGVLDAAATGLIETMLKREAHYRAIIEEKYKHIKTLLSSWPESHKQYIPKEDFVGVDYDPERGGKARALLEEVRSASDN